MSLNAYLFAASVTRTQVRPTQITREQTAEMEQTWGETPDVIVCGDSPDDAQTKFEAWLNAQPKGQHPLQTQVHKIVAAQLVDQLLLETGSAPLDWPQIARQSWTDVESTPAEASLSQGYWLDVNEVTGSSTAPEALHRDLPEDISSELNWSAERQYYFVIRVLSVPPPPPALDLPGEPAAGDTGDEPVSEAGAEAGDSELDGLAAEIPPLMDLEGAALIRARNSALAVWRWRQYAAGTPLAGNPICFEPWCGVLGVELPDNEPKG
jgi:hypothetical protein